MISSNVVLLVFQSVTMFLCVLAFTLAIRTAAMLGDVERFNTNNYAIAGLAIWYPIKSLLLVPAPENIELAIMTEVSAWMFACVFMRVCIERAKELEIISNYHGKERRHTES